MKSKTKNWIIAVLSALLALLGANEGYEYATGDALLYSKQAPYPSLDPEVADAGTVFDDVEQADYDAPWWQVYSVYEIENKVERTPGTPDPGKSYSPHFYDFGIVQNYMQPDKGYCEDYMPLFLEKYKTQTGLDVRCATVVSYTANNPNKKKKKK